jgi:hypothetical protein
MSKLLISRKKRITFFTSLIIIIIGLSSLFVYLHKNHFHGPLSKINGIQPDDWYFVSLPTKPLTPILLGGYPLKTSNQSITIQSISLSNTPNGLKVLSAGLLVADPEIMMVLKPDFKSMTNHKIQPLPMTLKTKSQYWMPVVWVAPTKPGNFVVNGLLVTYKIGFLEHTDYLRDQFEVCEGTSKCPQPPESPMQP